MTPTDSKKYAQEVLRLNPCVSAQQIIQRRARYLGIEKAPQQRAGADVDLPERRHRAEEALSKIRSEFWTVAAPEIEPRLAALSLEGLPDLMAAARRLARTTQVSAEFSRLAAERGVSKSFVESLRQIVVMAPAAAGQVKQRQEQTFNGRSALRSAKRTIRLICEKYPKIHELEAEWLDHVASFRPARKRPAQREKKASRNYLWLIWVAGFLILSILRSLAHK